MKEQQKRKIQQLHPEIEDGTDLRRWPHKQDTLPWGWVKMQKEVQDKDRDHFLIS